MTVNPLTGKALDALAHSTASINAYEGSVRSGKTVTTLIDWLRYCRTGPPGPLLMTGRTQRTIENNLIHPLQEMVGPSRCALNRGTGTLSLLGRTVYVIGANNEAARTKIQGLTLAGALVDEASTLPESFFNMLYSRLSVAGARLWLTTNPEGPEHWLKRKWLDRAALWIDLDGKHHKTSSDLDLHRFTFGIDDNPNLPPEYVERIKAAYTGLWYRRYIEGSWVAADGAVYDAWDPDRHVIAYDNLPPMREYLAVGVDHGTTNPSAAVLVGVGTDDRLYAIDEWYSAPATERARLTPAEQSRQLAAWLAQRPTARYVVVDSAAAGFRVQLKADGVVNHPAEKDVLQGINVIASLLASGLFLVTDRCKHLIAEFPSYVWDDKATAEGRDQPIGVDDHLLDALRYALLTTERIWRARVPLQLAA